MELSTIDHSPVQKESKVRMSCRDSDIRISIYGWQIGSNLITFVQILQLQDRLPAFKAISTYILSMIKRSSLGLNERVSKRRLCFTPFPSSQMTAELCTGVSAQIIINH